MTMISIPRWERTRTVLTAWFGTISCMEWYEVVFYILARLLTIIYVCSFPKTELFATPTSRCFPPTVPLFLQALLLPDSSS
jgi:hypothetical protein